jgi:hypothetical protein
MCALSILVRSSPRRTTIGDVRTWTIAKAQAEATRLKAQVDNGLDPR